MSEAPSKASFFDLQDHFWQLDEAQRFSGTETRLYFYWLNRFNAEFWPAQFSRWSKQVEADLGLTDKTLALARTTLVSRGLLSYTEGTRTRAAVWALAGVIPVGKARNYSGSRADDRNNSGPSDAISPDERRNNSGPSGGIPPHERRNNSGLYKEKTKTLNKDKDTAADAASSVVFENDVLAVLAEKKILPPVARAPTPVALGFEEFWEVYAKKQDTKKCRHHWEKLKPAQQQAALAAVAAYVAATPEKAYRKNPLTWLNGECWHDELPAPRLAPGQVPDPPARASTSPTKSKNNW